MAGTDARAIVAEFELIECAGISVLVQGHQQFVHAHPACSVELQPDALWLVAQDQAQKLALLDDFFFIHRKMLFRVWLE